MYFTLSKSVPKMRHVEYTTKLDVFYSSFDIFGDRRDAPKKFSWLDKWVQVADPFCWNTSDWPCFLYFVSISSHNLWKDET